MSEEYVTLPGAQMDKHDFTKPDLPYHAFPVAGLAGGVQRWIEHGIPPGHFLSAIISNDLLEAFRRADDSTASAMKSIVIWFYRFAPCGCWGSPTALSEWRGLQK